METKSLRARQNHQLQQLNREYADRKQQLIEDRERELATIKDNYNEKEQNLLRATEAAVNHIRRSSKEILDKEKSSADRTIQSLKTSMDNQKANYEYNVQRQREDHLNKLNVLEDQFQTQRQAASRTYDDELQQVSSTGERLLSKEKESQARELQTIRSEYAKDRETEHKKNANQLDREQKTFREKYNANKQIYHEGLKDQQARFEDNYKKKETEQRHNLHSQDQLYLKALQKQKIDQLKNQFLFESRSDDPFYKILDPKSDFNETATSYVLRAYIPEHDQHAMKITIQPEKISLQGHRSHKDSVNDDQRKVSSQQMQSFREEFTFTQPVAEKAALQERDGDYLTITIPKRG